MKPRYSLFVGAIAVFLSPALSAAGGLCQRLPDVGKWAEYEFELTEFENGRADEMGKGSLRIACVGNTKLNGKACRWIELEVVLKDVERESRGTQRTVYKLLVDERELTANGSPAENMARGWEVHDRSGVVSTPSRLRKVDGKPTIDIFAVFLAPPLTDAKALPPRSINVLGESVNCKGVQGSCILPAHALNTPDVLKYHVKLRLHDASPVGVAFYEAEITRPDGDVLRLRLNLREVGDGAKSKLAEYE